MKNAIDFKRALLASAVSLALAVPLAYAADGSNPQWIAQCSQRGSLPGPYASHSMPSSSASYVGKIPSVSR